MTGGCVSLKLVGSEKCRASMSTNMTPMTKRLSRYTSRAICLRCPGHCLMSCQPTAPTNSVEFWLAQTLVLLRYPRQISTTSWQGAISLNPLIGNSALKNLLECGHSEAGTPQGKPSAGSFLSKQLTCDQSKRLLKSPGLRLLLKQCWRVFSQVVTT